ncbi:hypothetical protein H0H93_009378 [Arthromyces matolae]|nr:hypothetical protein H0H93_009378 [Arthromyces matolae]
MQHDDGSGSAQATPSIPTITLNEPGSTVTTVASGTLVVTQTNSGYTQSTLVPLNGTTMRNPFNSTGSASAVTGYSTLGSTSTTSQAIATISDGQSDHKASHVGAIAGGVVGAVALILIALMSILSCRHRWRASLERPASNGQLTWHAPVLTPFTASFPQRTRFEGALIFSSDNKPQDTMAPSHIPHSSTILITASANSEPLRQKRQNMIKRQMKNLKSDLRARGKNGTIDPSPISPNRWGDADLTRMIKQNQAMKTEIRRLHAQLNSEWALGLSDEPPPDYTRNAAGLDRCTNLAEAHSL